MTVPNLLHRLTRLYGVQTAYRDGLKQRREAPLEAILRALQALGAPILLTGRMISTTPIGNAAKRSGSVSSSRSPWFGRTNRYASKFGLPANSPKLRRTIESFWKTATTLDGELHDDPTFTSVSREVEAVRYVTRRLLGPTQIPLGYHRLYLRIGELEVESYLICAPIHAYTPADRGAKRWGLFCPLYALHSERSWGAATFPISKSWWHSPPSSAATPWRRCRCWQHS